MSSLAEEVLGGDAGPSQDAPQGPLRQVAWMFGKVVQRWVVAARGLPIELEPQPLETANRR